MNNGRTVDMLKNVRSGRPSDKLIKDRYDFVYKMADYWKSHGVTALIMPIWPHTAVKRKNTDELGLFYEYATMWNLCGFPCGVLPVTKVTASEQSFSDNFNDKWTSVLNEDCQGSEGLPVHVQVVGYVNEDEKVLGIMKLLEDDIGYKMDFDIEVDMDYKEGENQNNKDKVNKVN